MGIDASKRDLSLKESLLIDVAVDAVESQLS